MVLKQKALRIRMEADSPGIHQKFYILQTNIGIGSKTANPRTQKEIFTRTEGIRKPIKHHK